MAMANSLKLYEDQLVLLSNLLKKESLILPSNPLTFFNKDLKRLGLITNRLVILTISK